MERARQVRISPVEISAEKKTRAREMTTLPTNARLCHRCAQHYIGRTCPKCPPPLASAPPPAPVAPRAADVPRLVLRLKGQVRGGKNNMGRTKTGKSYPKKLFADWRAEAIRQIRAQLPSGWTPIAVPVNVRIDYVAEDRRRRDFPAICDALWHALERAGVVSDDTLLWPAQSSRSYDKAAPGVTITFLDTLQP